MRKNRSHSKIDRLPDVVKKQVENKLLEGHTYEQIAQYLKNMGQEIHYSTVARYGKPFLEKFEAVRMAKDYAQLLAEDNPDRPTTELHEANNAL
ncbi:MAG: phage protein Gp27 family protein [Anaerotignaceae bacterium]